MNRIQAEGRRFDAEWRCANDRGRITRQPEVGREAVNLTQNAYRAGLLRRAVSTALDRQFDLNFPNG